MPWSRTASGCTRCTVTCGSGASTFSMHSSIRSAVLKGGVLNAELARLALYGGGVSATLKLDASAADLDVDAGVNIDKVKVDQLMLAATGEKSVVGIASGELKVKSKGRSPRALAENLSGKFSFALGGVNVKNAPVGAISEVKLNLDLPGLEKQPKLQGSVVYNKQRVNLDATVDPLQKLLESSSFAANLSLTSKLLTAKYVGKVQHRPVPGLDGNFDLDVPSVGKLAAWLGQPLAKGQPDPGPLKVAAVMSSDGENVVLKEATITGKAIKAKASGSLKAGKPAPRFDAKIDILEADLNAYLPAEKKQKAKAKAGPAGPAPWSKQPIDFSGLTAANGKATVSLNKVKYKNLEINDGRITLTLEKGVMTTAIESLKLAGGTIKAQAKVDASGKAAKISYGATINGVNARPVLIAFADTDRLSGTMNVSAEGQTQGRSEYELVSALNGKGSLQFLDGALHGVNIAATLRKAQSLGISQKAGESQKTDFAELGGTYVIKNGVVDNRDFKMLAPLVRLTGAGLVPMPPQTVDYEVVATLVASLKGQGGTDALAGIPIPVRVTGTWQKPDYNVDWDSVFKNIAADPARLANMPKDLLGAAQNLGIALPGLKTDGLLKGLGGGTSTSGTTSGTTTDQTKTTEDPIKSLTKDPIGTLKGLFKK